MVYTRRTISGLKRIDLYASKKDQPQGNIQNENIPTEVNSKRSKKSMENMNGQTNKIDLVLPDELQKQKITHKISNASCELDQGRLIYETKVPNIASDCNMRNITGSKDAIKKVKELTQTVQSVSNENHSLKDELARIHLLLSQEETITLKYADVFKNQERNKKIQDLKIENLEKTLEEFERHNIMQESKIENLENTLDEAEKTIEIVTTKNRNLQIEGRENQTLNQAHGLQVQNLETDLNETQKVVETLTKRNQIFQKEKLKLESLNKAQELKTKSLEKKLAQAEKANTTLTTENQILQEGMRDAENLKQAQDLKVVNLEKKVDEVENTVSIVTTDIKRLKECSKMLLNENRELASKNWAKIDNIINYQK